MKLAPSTKNFTITILSAFLFVLFRPAPVIAFDLSFLNFSKPWNLPVDLNDSNTKIRFDVETSIFGVHGSAHNISGKIWLSDEKNYASILAEILIPIKDLNTGNESRDKKIREIMHEDKYPNIIFKARQLSRLCNPAELKAPCHAELKGLLSLANTTKELTIPVTIIKKDSNYSIQGNVQFNWMDFGIEDPSTFLSKVDHQVKISFDLAI